VAAVADTEEQLAWERRQAKGAALAALAAAFFTFVGTVWRGLTLGDLPRTNVADTIGLAAQPGPVGEATSLRVPTFEYYQDHATAVVASSFMVAIGYIALGWTLSYLAAATRARRPELPKIMLYLPIIGGVLQGISTIVSSFATRSAISSFLDGPRTVDAALDIGTTGLAVFAQILGLPGALALALALVLIALNAMRVGLLTRFMGVLGMITGALQILPIGGPLPVVQAFWLIMLSVLFLGRWPNGQPPAWASGKAEPWPSSADVRAQRQKAMAARRGEAPPDDAEPAEVEEPVPANGPSPSTSATKRKRKRR
jgi:hypothetical protein